MDGYLALEGERIVEARGMVSGKTHGELVFTTAYTGYEESLTDPSYEKQVLVFSYPLIGNYGVREERFESERVHPTAVIARELTEDITKWLSEQEVPAIDHIDTRELVLRIRDEGAMKCGIAVGDVSHDDALEQLDKCRHMSEHKNIGKEVSIEKPKIYNKNGNGPEIALIDCGAKGSIIDSLIQRGSVVHLLPYDTSRSEIREIKPDILFISNGPGDPANFVETENLIDELAGDIPIAGICLGQQIVARALGGKTEKMRFGHRGANQPVKDLRTDKVFMTTQNHGYMVSDPGSLKLTQKNVNDDTSEGLDSRKLNIITRQYHPEAHPGPRDTLSFFDDVVDLAKNK